jgi:hypothetical protein
MQFAQKNTKLIAIATLSTCAVLLLGGIVSAIVFRKPPAQAQAAPTPAVEQQASPAPTPTPSPSSSPEIALPAQPNQPVSPSVIVANPLPVAVVLPAMAANLRQAPSVQSIVKGVVLPGQTVQVKPGVISQNGVVWYPVVFGEEEGWIASGLLSQPAMPEQGEL